jgi:xylulokinase
VDTYVGLDLGTSGLKAAVLDENGATRATAEASFGVSSPQPGWAETDPQAWVAAAGTVMEELGPHLGGVRALGIAGQMHGAVVCDGSSTALRPAILWPDRRAKSQVELWRRLPEETRARLANPIVPGMTGPIVRWLLDHEPSIMEEAATVLLPKDYLRVALGGSPRTDRSDASATLLWDVPADTWSLSTLDAVGLPQRLLPAAGLSAAPDGTVTWPGPLRGVPMVVGCADTAAALLASSLAPGEVQVNLGTGIQVLRPVGEPWARADPAVHLYAAATHGWYAMAAVQNGGLALDWVRHLFGLEWTTLFEIAGTSSADGVSFLPFLTGERGGVAPPSARGAWVGMTERTTRDNLVRAAVEGLAFCVRRGLELLDVSGAPVLLSGGGARTPVLRQLVADVLDAPARYEDLRSASAIGAARLGALGLGARIDAGPRATRATGGTCAPRPSAELTEAYQTWLYRLRVGSSVP